MTKLRGRHKMRRAFVAAEAEVYKKRKKKKRKWRVAEVFCSGFPSPFSKFARPGGP
jgi:hypothetical protein